MSGLERAKLLVSGRMAKFTECSLLKLTDPLASESHAVADLLQRHRFGAIQAEIQLDDFVLTLI